MKGEGPEGTISLLECPPVCVGRDFLEQFLFFGFGPR